MSKAFTKEDAGADEVVVPRRAPLPEGTPNYVTRRGLQDLRDELTGWETERARLQGRPSAEDARRLAIVIARENELKERIGSAQVVEPGPGAADTVRFGTVVTLRGGEGPVRHYRIVGVDEANPAQGRLAFNSPLGRALLGRQVGDVVTLRAVRGNEELEIVAIEVGEGDALAIEPSRD